MATPISQETLFMPQEVQRWAEAYAHKGGDFLQVVRVAFHHLVTDQESGEPYDQAEDMLKLARWELYEEIAQIISSPTQLGAMYRSRLLQALNDLAAFEEYVSREQRAQQALFLN
jgi:hypothetical protein